MKPITYPNPLRDIARLGKPAPWKREFMLRPLRVGRYSLLAWPTHALELRMVQRIDLVFRNASTPEQVLLDVPRMLRSFREWSWKLVRWPTRMRVELPRGMPAISTLMFDERAAIEGRFSLDDDAAASSHRIVLWSCHQPYATADTGEGTLHQDLAGLLEWVEQRVEEFAPHVVWALGDTAYADGTKATNFVDQAYSQVDLQGQPELHAELLSAYRRMYRAHWSFAPLQRLMCSIPHLCMWDDHEIRDGWGSEDEDFAGGNPLVFQIARQAADEYILAGGPRVRPSRDGVNPDAHQAYVAGNIAAFIFDGRSSRRYADPGGSVISEQQLSDFDSFCRQIRRAPHVKFLVMGSAVPFINLKDFVEELGSQAPKALTDLMAGIRDDIRDSWHSKGNREQLGRLIDALRRLHRRRPDIDIVNLSGDIHVANAFSFQPRGFTKALYQFTSSGLTNRDHPPGAVAALVDLGTTAFTEVLGFVTRIWDSLDDPNIMLIAPRGEALRITLRVFDLELPPAQRGNVPSPKDLVFDVGNETFGVRRLLAA